VSSKPRIPTTSRPNHEAPTFGQGRHSTANSIPADRFIRRRRQMRRVPRNRASARTPFARTRLFGRPTSNLELVPARAFGFCSSPSYFDHCMTAVLNRYKRDSEPQRRVPLLRIQTLPAKHSGGYSLCRPTFRSRLPVHSYAQTESCKSMVLFLFSITVDSFLRFSGFVSGRARSSSVFVTIYRVDSAPITESRKSPSSQNSNAPNYCSSPARSDRQNHRRIAPMSLRCWF